MKNGGFWSCYPDSDRGPHPYQVIGTLQFIAMQCFLALFAPKG